MTQQELDGRLKKAATAGLVQELINSGSSAEDARRVAIAYAAPGGMLEKRASNMEQASAIAQRAMTIAASMAH